MSVFEKMNGATSTNRQESMRQWFVALSPEERAAALGFRDATWTALWTDVVRASSSSLSLSASQNVSSSEKGASGAYIYMYE